MSEDRQGCVLVTGAARGIGRAIAERFAGAGHRVVVTDLDAAAARACADAIGGQAMALALDVRDPAQAAAAVEAACARHGAIEVLVNNAGRMTQGPFEQTAAADFEALLAVNVGGIYHLVQAVALGMRQRGRGAILNLASVSSVRGGGAVGNVWYGASKAAVVALTAGLARELGPQGVRVNAISPGLVETEMVRPFLTPETRARVLTRFPMGRLATVDDVARLALFLCSDDAGFVNGQTVAVDGGFLTQ
ncbi:MAG: glucose 1-dehydrogenase [Burkholderiales bacterium]|nr:glucose 1-dehydrogenase [Burkholderiales bacterium]